jgi:hypothetical protein
VHEGRLAATVMADDGDDLAGFDFEVYVIVDEATLF